MAVAPTGNIFKALSFDNVSSRTYGVYITGEAVYNAPEREVEMISIPGRNGAFALDKGRFENIEVTYPAGIFADSESNFAEAVSDFRNFLCSRKGYVRLTDEYNPNEYRMAVYKSGLEVEPAQLKAGEFEITFDCKPQRFLTSGETAVTVANNGTLSNPTLFESKPLLMIYGYGNIDINDSHVTINNIEVGKVELCKILPSKGNFPPHATYRKIYTFDPDILNSGDVIRVSCVDAIVEYYENTNWEIINSTIDTESGSTMDYYTYDGLTYTYSGYGIVGYKLLNMEFVKGTSKTYTRSTRFQIEYYNNSENPVYEYMGISASFAYDGADKFTATITTVSVATHSATRYAYFNEYNTNRTVYGTSTKSALGAPLYVDCEIGEAYKYEGDTLVSINDVASLPAELPVLSPGVNSIGCDNTVTRLDIVPRWWKV